MTLILGKTEVDVRFVEHLIEEGQLEICGWIIKKVKDKQKREGRELSITQKILKDIESSGLETITPHITGIRLFQGIKMFLQLLTACAKNNLCFGS